MDTEGDLAFDMQSDVDDGPSLSICGGTEGIDDKLTSLSEIMSDVVDELI